MRFEIHATGKGYEIYDRKRKRVFMWSEDRIEWIWSLLNRLDRGEKDE